jgi:hypothetical protein
MRYQIALVMYRLLSEFYIEKIWKISITCCEIIYSQNFASQYANV